MVPIGRSSHPCRTHRSTRELEAAIRTYIDVGNEVPKPFVWTKTADEIFEELRKYCLRTSDSGHQRQNDLRFEMSRFEMTMRWI